MSLIENVTFVRGTKDTLVPFLPAKPAAISHAVHPARFLPFRR